MGRRCRRFRCSTQSRANKSDTDRFITVDGDNKLVNYEKLIDLELDFSDYELENLNPIVISFTGYNNINGLMYGNGGTQMLASKSSA